MPKQKIKPIKIKYKPIKIPARPIISSKITGLKYPKRKKRKKQRISEEIRF